MRILILTSFFVGLFFFFTKEKKVEVVAKTPEVDQIKVSSAAPNREERLLTVKKKPEIIEETAELEEENSPESQIGREINAEEVEDIYSMPDDHVEEVPVTDLDQSWNDELKNVLTDIAPEEAEVIHKSYLSELDNYQVEMDALLNEKQQKATQAEALEVEQLMSQLDQRHEENLRNIFGPNYEAVRDHYQDYMRSNLDE